jgi:nicotinate-nucleotide--dimethylbenzimidazole phosphoribosyltransferase
MQIPWLTGPCRAPSDAHRDSACERQRQLTKPLGSLGRLEVAAIELAAMQGRDHPALEQVPVLLFAGDHGVTARGVSAYPAEVTVQMLDNFAGGGAAIAVLAKELGLPLHVRDVGTRAAKPIAGVIMDRRRYGTADLAEEAAMETADLEHALAAGRRAFEEAGGALADMVLLGEMGIGNTTAASAMAALLGPLALEDVVGAGTGLDMQRIAHKCRVLDQALQLHARAVAEAPVPALEAIRRVGGLEIAAMVGAIVTAAQHGVPVLVDGFIVTVAALAAVRINPQVRPWLLFSHQSAERGHVRMLELLQGTPLLQLDLRLGEGSGAALAIPLLRMACALHNQMATFEEAAVSDKGADHP